MIDINKAIEDAAAAAVQKAMGEYKPPTYLGMGLGERLASMVQCIGELTNCVEALRQDMQTMHARINGIREDMEGWDAGAAGVNTRMSGIEGELDVMSRRIRNAVEERELNSDELADTIKELFSDGTLTISIDKI